MAARKQKHRRMSAQVVEDEDYQLRYEVVAGIDVAKESAVVCVRLPPAEGRKHRTSHLQTVPATVPAIGELAAELKAAGVQMVSMEATSDYVRSEGASLMWEAPFGGSADVEGVVPGPVRDGLSPPRRASRVTVGCEASGNKPKGSRSIRELQARRRPAGSMLPGPGGGEAVGVMGE